MPVGYSRIEASHISNTSKVLGGELRIHWYSWNVIESKVVFKEVGIDAFDAFASCHNHVRRCPVRKFQVPFQKRRDVSKINAWSGTKDKSGDNSGQVRNAQDTTWHLVVSL